MGDSFQGKDILRLQPGESNVPVRMRFKAATASTLNDGALPYASTIKSVVSKAVWSANNLTSATGLLSSAVTLSSETVTLYFSHTTSATTVPTKAADGLYHATITLRISNGSTDFDREFDFNRIYLRDY